MPSFKAHRLRAHLPLLPLIVLCVLALACFVGSAAFAHPLTIAVTEPGVESLDPQLGGTRPAEQAVMALVYNALVRFPPGSVDLEALQPDLAATWRHDEDFTSWTFILRPGVQFHKGYGELTAADAKFSLERNLMDASPWREAYGNIDQIAAPDPYTLIVELHAPDPFFLVNVSNHRGGFVTSKRAVEERGEPALDPIGTGPFVFESYRTGSRLATSANLAFFRGAPQLEGVNLRFLPDRDAREAALRRDDVAIIAAEADEAWLDFLEVDGFRPILVGPGVPYFLYLDPTEPPLDDVRVRQAIRDAIDRAAFVGSLAGAGSVPIRSPVPLGFLGHAEDVLAYDRSPARSRSLLAEAGVANGLTLPVAVADDPFALEAIALVQAQLQDIGIRVEVEVREQDEWSRRVRRGETALVAYPRALPPTADAILDYFVDASTVTGDAPTDGRSGDVELTNLIAEARGVSDPERRLEIYREAQRHVLEEALIVPLASAYNVFVMPDRFDLALPPSPFDAPDYFVPIDETTPPGHHY